MSCPLPAGPTLLLDAAGISALMDQADWLEAAEIAFRGLADGSAQAPPPVTLAGLGGTFHAKGASLVCYGDLHVAVKLNGNFPANPQVNGLPTIQGAVLLCDGTTGELHAILDSAELTIRRTAAATALAARHLARPDSRALLICGCGGQAEAQLAALAFVLPLERVHAWDRDPARAEALAASARRLGLAAERASDLAAAALASDVIVTCTTSTSPFLAAAHVRPGSFIAATGADSPGKAEIMPDLVARSRLVVDHLAGCLAGGDLRNAIEAGAVAASHACAELATLVAGKLPGRTDDQAIFLFDSTGIGVQDVAAAALIRRKAVERGHGVRIMLRKAA